MSDRPSRRQFLAGAASAVSTLTAGAAMAAGGKTPVAPRPTPGGSVSAATSTVVIMRDRHLIPARIVSRGLLRSHLDRTVAAVVGEKEAGAAWHRLLREDDNILIKFNQSMSALMGTNSAMAETLVASLTAAGFDPQRTILLEVDPAVREITKTRRPDHRWQGKMVEFGASGRDSFRADVDWATAIINVPLLKTHRRAVMTGCLKNLSHGLIRRPARFHASGCDPAIGEINASTDLTMRLKLSIVNGLRVNFSGGGGGSETEIANEGMLIAGTDAVACDSIGFHQIGRIRAERGLRPLLSGPELPRQLTTAERLGVGIANRERVSVHSLVW